MRILKARWREVPEQTQQIVKAAVGALFAILVWALINHALAYAIGVILVAFWSPKLPTLWRFLLQAALVAAFLIAYIQGYADASVPIVIALCFAISWIPPTVRVGGGDPKQRGGPVLTRGTIIGLIILVLVVAYPFITDHLFSLPLFGAFPDVYTGVYMIVFMMMAVGLNIVVGYAGLLDLGYVAFYAVGAYTSAWFASTQFSQLNIHILDVGSHADPGIHLSYWLLLPLAGLITAAFGILIGLPTLRLRGDYLAIVTLGFGEILPRIANNGNNLFGFNLTNGPNGITTIDPPGWGHALGSIGVWHFHPLPQSYQTCCSASLFGHSISRYDVYFWTAILLLLFTVFCSLRLRESRIGRAWVAIREDETAAGAMGIPLMRTKTWAYASGAFFGGVAGAYYAGFKGNTFPGDFYFNISVFILCMVILGGMGNVWGVLLGAALLSYLNIDGLPEMGNWLNQNLQFGSWHPHIGPTTMSNYEGGIYGLLIVTVMLLRPEGLLPSKRRARELHDGVHDEPAYDIAHGAREQL